MNSLFIILFLSCQTPKQPATNPSLQQKQPPQNKEQKATKDSKSVANRTKEQLKKDEEAKRACIQQCIKSRQAEAISADLIKTQCTVGCNKKHILKEKPVQLTPGLKKTDQ